MLFDPQTLVGAIVFIVFVTVIALFDPLAQKAITTTGIEASFNAVIFVVLIAIIAFLLTIILKTITALRRHAAFETCIVVGVVAIVAGFLTVNFAISAFQLTVRIAAILTQLVAIVTSFKTVII